MAPWEKAAQWREVAPELAGEVVALAKRHAEHLWKLEVEEAAHRQRMDVRIWITQVVGHVLGLASVAAFAVVAWHYSDVGRTGPGIATLGIGTAATATVFALGRATRPTTSVDSIKERRSKREPG
jgi:hypothetical protein